MIDFDKLFGDYVTEYIHANLGKKKMEDLEAEVPELYSKWQNTFSSELNATPADYVANLKSSGQLAAYVDELICAGAEIADIVGDAFDGADEQGLMDLFEKHEDYRHVIMGILKNIATARPETEKFLVETALHSADEGLREMAAEALFEGHPGVVDAILDEIDGLSEDVQLLAFDVLYRYPGSDRTLAKLVAHFRTGENIPLFAEYIASFGDERAIPELIAYAKSASMTKFEFREIRNAVEALGGDMPDYNYEIVG